MTHQHKPKLEKAGHRRIMTVLLMFVFIDGMMFIAAGTLRWPLGWAYVSVTPLALGSWWALLPGGIAAAAMLVRTVLEDKTLQVELDGYGAYAKRVRYRLLPGIW